MRAATRSITIACSPDQVFDFVAHPANLPLWSRSFCLSVHQENGQWIVETPAGPVKVRIATQRQLRIADQFLSPAPGVEVMIPTRVVPNGSGSEFIFTLFQPDHLSEEEYLREVQLVEQELELLKQVLEKEMPLP
ncbi:MAG: SRPBCC family protein [Candidatus Sericytochromatia bacterium]